MYDLHAHILPGIDDGPRDMEEAVAMLKAASADGIKGMAMTPHVIPGLHDNPKEKVVRLTEELKAGAAGIDIELYPASEIRLSDETLEGLKSGALCTINGSRYVLAELPSMFDPGKINEMVCSLRETGLVPVIAHPERNPVALKDVECLYELVSMGALMQVTAGSFLGMFGDDARKLAVSMLERRLAHVIASDAHDSGPRPPVLSAAVREVSKLIGERAARAMVHAVPEMILKNEQVNTPEPVRPKKNLFFFSDLPFFD